MAGFKHDLTEGSVTRQLIRFSMPFLFSNFLQALYNLVDMLVVSVFNGDIGVSSVSIGGQITMLIMNIITGLATGVTVLVAQYIGAKQDKDRRQTTGTMAALFLLIGVVITIVMLFAGGPFLHLLQTPPDSFDSAKAYLDISMLGTIFIFGYNAVSAVLRGMGDSKRPMYFVMIATVVNVILDLVFVGPMGMGAAGAALATIIAQALSFVLSVIYLIKKDFFAEFTLADFKFNWHKSSLLLRIGLPSAAQGVLVSISFLFLTMLVNSLDNPVIASACQGIGARVNGFAILPGIAIASAISSMAGQNIGAGRHDRAKKTMWVGFGLIQAVTIIIFIFIQFFAEGIMNVFTSTPETITVGAQYLRIIAGDFILSGMVFALNSLAIAAGQTSFAFFNAILSSILTRIPLAYLFAVVLGWGMPGIGWAITIAPIPSILFGLWYVRAGKWKKTSAALVSPY